MQYVPLVGRILFSVIFIMFGLAHFTDPNVQAMAEQSGVPLPGLATIVTGIMIIIGGLSVLLGFRAKWGGWLLAAFLIPTAFLMHGNFGDPNQMAHFMKNLSMAGGALFIAHFGSGPLSLDDRLGGSNM